MHRDRILQWATALLLIVPSSAFAQAPGDPSEETEPPEATSTETEPDETPSEEDEKEDEEADEGDVPMGTPQTVDDEAEPEDAPTETDPETEDAEAATASTSADEEEEKTVVVKRREVVQPVEESDVGVSWNQGLSIGEKYRWNLWLGGYIRVGYTAIQDDPSGTFGQHDGFTLGNARLALKGRMRSLGFKFQFDGAVGRNVSANDPNAEVVMRMKDANLYFQPFEPLRLTAGQFKPPFDVEEQFSTSQILFVQRSVASRGVSDIAGRNVRGLSVDRQVGVKLGNERGYFFTAEGDQREGPGVSYAVAVTNGQDSNRALNDNDKLAGFGRAAIHWGTLVSAGGGFYFNDKTIGVEPDTLEERRTGWTADLTVDVVGFTLIGSVIGESTTRPDLSGVEPQTKGLGYQGQLAYREPFFGFQPAFRYAYFNPTEQSDASDQLTHLTFGLNYLPDYPIRLMLNYTIAQETPEFEIPNNRFDGVLQVTW